MKQASILIASIHPFVLSTRVGTTTVCCEATCIRGSNGVRAEERYDVSCSSSSLHKPVAYLLEQEEKLINVLKALNKGEREGVLAEKSNEITKKMENDASDNFASL